MALRVAVAAAGEAAEIVGEEVLDDVFDVPAGVDVGDGPLVVVERFEEAEEGGAFFGEKVDGEDGGGGGSWG